MIREEPSARNMELIKQALIGLINQTHMVLINLAYVHGLINQAQMGSYQSDIDGINQ